MASVLELAVSTGKWDAGIKKAKQSLDNFVSSQGGLQSALAKDNDKMGKFVQMMGKMDSEAKTSKGQMNDYKQAIEQLTIQFNKLTDAQKNSIGQEYQKSIEQLTDKYRKAKEQLDSFNQSLNGKNANIPITTNVGVKGGFLSGDKMSGMLQVLGGNLMTKAVSMAGNLAMEMGQMVTQGIELAKQGEGIRIAFERLGRGDILEGLREVTHGTVSDLELMKAAVKFNDFKLPVDELGTMLAFAQQKAKDTGQSVDYMVDSIVTGLGRKSLMILDNLGLSAAEIKEKMAQTGDMTKAVGEIIREQMSKAGEYIETAADKATAADVRLKNAMTDLGNTLQPLSSDFGNFWNELKIGGLKFLNNVLGPIVSKMTEAGQIASAKNRMGGSDTVNSQLNTLSGSNMKQVTMLSQLAQYDRQIKELQAASSNVIVPASGQGAQFALNQIKSYENQIKALQQMREEYRKAAMDIIAPKSVENTTSTPTTPSKVSTQKLKEEYIPLEGSIDAMTAKVKELQTAFNQTADQSVRGKLLVEIQNVQKHLDFMKGSGLGLASVNRNNFSSKLDSNQLMKDAGKQMQAYINLNNDNKQMTVDIKDITGNVSNILGGLNKLGIEIPEGLSETIGTMQTISSILTSILTITTLIKGEQSADKAIKILDAILPFANGGIVKAANGMVVPGSNFSGDNLRMPILDGGGFVGINSGELILNKAQQNAVASDLQQAAASRTINIKGILHGKDIILSVDRTGQSLGYGQLLFGKNI